MSKAVHLLSGPAGFFRHEPLRALALVAAATVAALVVVSPLDRHGRDGLLTAHVIQHVALADLVAPLLLLGLPVAGRRTLARALAGLRSRQTRPTRAAAWVFTPLGAAAVWAALTYLWLVPPIHRAAVPAGVVHAADHVAFLLAGVLVWLVAFDPRPERPLREAVRDGGLPWWARHAYAMATRAAMLPPAIFIWVAASSAYHTGAPLPFDLSIQEDQERAASIMIGFEMLLSAIAVVLAFVFLSVHEGRERARARS